MDPTPRLIAIEEKLAHLEKYVGDLDEVIREMAGRLESQAKGAAQMRSILDQHLAGGDDKSDATDPAQDRPPHW